MLGYYLLKIVTSDGALHDNQKAEYLIADKGYNSQHIVVVARIKGHKVVFPPRENARNPEEYDKELHRMRHLSADFVLCEPSNKNGFVTTPTARIPASLATCYYQRCACPSASSHTWRNKNYICALNELPNLFRFCKISSYLSKDLDQYRHDIRQILRIFKLSLLLPPF